MSECRYNGHCDYKGISELEQQNEALLAQVEEMRSTISIISCDMGLMCDDGSNALHRTVARWSDKLDELIDTYPAQSLSSIKASVEAETIGRCVNTVITEPEYIANSQEHRRGYARAVNDMRMALQDMHRKYQPT